MVCSTPFGFPVLPDVYRMNSGCSLSSGSAGQSALAAATRSCHQWSRPAFISTAVLQRLSTTHVRTLGDFSSAASTFAFRGITLPRRQPPSAVMTSFACASLLRSATASAEKPPKMTEWVAPMRAQASMATAASGTIGM